HRQHGPSPASAAGEGHRDRRPACQYLGGLDPAGARRSLGRRPDSGGPSGPARGHGRGLHLRFGAAALLRAERPCPAFHSGQKSGHIPLYLTVLRLTFRVVYELQGRSRMTDNTVTRAHLAEAVYQEVGLSRNESAELVEAVLNEMSEALKRGET